MVKFIWTYEVFRNFKLEILINSIHKRSSYLTENTLRLRSKICDDGILTLLLFFGHYPSSCFFKKQRFGDWILSPSYGRKPTKLGAIDKLVPVPGDGD
jgi:hypothetical protein